MKTLIFLPLLIILINTVSAQPVTDGLTLWLPFNGNANDASGNGYDITNHGAELTDDRNGNPDSAYHFDGESYIDLGTVTFGIEEINNFTISLWINVQDNIGDYDIIIKRGEHAYPFSISLHSDNRIRTRVRPSGGSSDYFSSPEILNHNQWYHVALTYGSGERINYINGNPEPDPDPPTGALSLESASTYIGSSPNAADTNFNGIIDDVRIYNRALTESEILALYTGQQQAIHESDLNSDGAVDLGEMIAYINRWKASVSDVSMRSLMEAIGIWKSGAQTQTVPSAPTGLTASAVSSSRIDLSWTDNSDNEQGFTIERGTVSGTYSQIGTVTAGTTTYISTGLAAETTYYYRVMTYNAAGNSGYSNEDSATTPASSQTIPNAPTELAATTSSSYSIQLTWTDNSDDEDGFLIEMSTDGTTFNQIDGVSENTESYSSSGLTPETTYYYRVRAYNTAGNSDYSNEVSETTLSPGAFQQPDVPQSIDVTIEQPFPPLEDIINKPDSDMPVYGLYTWYTWFEGYGSWEDEITAVGIKSLRVGTGHRVLLSDSAMETFANNDFEILYMLQGSDRGNFGEFNDIDNDNAFIADYLDFIDEAIGRFGPNGDFWTENPSVPYNPIIYWEMWNEPNEHYLLGEEYWDELDMDGKAELYSRLLIASYNHIRDNPDWDEVKIVGFAASGSSINDVGWPEPGFIEMVHQYLESYGGSAQYYDILSDHPYVHDFPPDSQNLHSEWYDYSIATSFEDYHSTMINHGNSDKGVWFTEIGWHRDTGDFPAGDNYVSERLQAAYVVRLYLTAMRLGVERVHVMFMQDADGFNGGFWTDDHVRYEETDAVQKMIEIMPKPRLTGAINDGGYGDNDLPDSEGYYAYTFDPDTDIEGENDVIVAWNVTGPSTVDIPVQPGAQYNIVDMLGGTQPVTASSDQLAVEIGPCPTYVIKTS
jgi:hypothetical protein